MDSDLVRFIKQALVVWWLSCLPPRWWILVVRASTDHRKDTVTLECSNATFCANSKENGKPKRNQNELKQALHIHIRDCAILLNCYDLSMLNTPPIFFIYVGYELYYLFVNYFISQWERKHANFSRIIVYIKVSIFIQTWWCGLFYFHVSSIHSIITSCHDNVILTCF